MKLTEKRKSSFTRVVVFGLPGTGKSTLVAQLSAKFKLLWISLDNDSDILFKLPQEQQDNVELIDIPDSAAFPVGCQTLLHLFKTQKGTVCHAHGNWNCPACKKNNPEAVTAVDLTNLGQEWIVCLDTGSQLGRSILAHATKDKPVDYKPERDDWGTLRKFSEFFASQFQAARFNLVVICHAVEAELEDGKTRLVTDFGSKGMSGTFIKAFSHAVYCDIVNKKHKAFSSSTASGTFVSKSRTDFEIEKMEFPSLIPIFEGLVPPTNAEETPAAKSETPAHAAVTGLAAVRARLGT